MRSVDVPNKAQFGIKDLAMTQGTLCKLMTPQAERIREDLFRDRADPAQIALKGTIDGIPAALFSETLQASYTLEKKAWAFFSPLLLATKEAAEQCSSYATANWKQQSFGTQDTLGPAADLTHGLGVDSWALSAQSAQNNQNNSFIGCERNPDLHDIINYNRSILQLSPIETILGDSIGWLRETNEPLHTLFIDPARRHGSRRSLALENCEPNLQEHHSLLLTKADRYLAKLAPGLHYGETSELPHIFSHTVLSVGGECKEAVIECRAQHSGPLQRQAVILKPTGEVAHSLIADPNQHMKTGLPLGFIGDPDPAIRLIDAAATLAERYGGQLTHHHDQFITMDSAPSDFPGRLYRIIAWESSPWKKCRAYLQQNNINQCHILRRGIRETQDILHKKLRVHKGPHPTIFCTRTVTGAPLWIHAERML